MWKLLKILALSYILTFSIKSIVAAQTVITYNGAEYEISKSPNGKYSAKVVKYLIPTIEIADSVVFDGMQIPVQDAVDYNKKTCTLNHYDKIDFSNAVAISTIKSQQTDSINIDTLILPPHILGVPAFNDEHEAFVKSLPADIDISESIASADVPIGIHRVFFSGTDDLQYSSSFAGCISLQEVDFANKEITYLPIFNNCYFLETCRIPESVQYISNAFMFCHKINSFGEVKAGYFNHFKNLYSLGEEVLLNGATIDTIHIGVNTNITGLTDNPFSSVRSIKWFEVDEGNPWYSSANGCLLSADGKSLIRYPHGNTRSTFEIPRQIENLRGVFFSPNRTSNYQEETFLHEIVFHEGINKVCSKAFYDMYQPFICKGFEHTNIHQLDSYAFFGSGLSEIELPPCLKSIGGAAFASCRNLRIMNFSNLPMLKDIALNAFTFTPLKDIDLLSCESLENIDFAAFKFKTSLSDEEIAQLDNDDVLLTGIVSLKLPANLKKIGREAFFRNHLKLVTCMMPEPLEIDSSVFGFVDRKNCKLYVPVGSVTAYKNASVWNEFDIEGVQTYRLYVSSSDTLCGKTCGSGVYPSGYIATITANPAKGYEFKHWTDGNISRVRKIPVTSDASYIAVFAPKASNETDAITHENERLAWHIEDNTIFIDDDVRGDMRIWTTEGKVVWSGKAQTITLNIPAGIYILSIAGKSSFVVFGK
ncbi:MAG: leucine-rich repeat protein [Paludibacteraceae bacterium]|nr:leucine-rich repeat protein [Paludibacteraceae bacterium]